MLAACSLLQTTHLQRCNVDNAATVQPSTPSTSPQGCAAGCVIKLHPGPGTGGTNKLDDSTTLWLAAPPCVHASQPVAAAIITKDMWIRGTAR
jgi:hypothetical protein